MAREIKIGDRMVGDGYPAYMIAEIGINHNGDLGIVSGLDMEAGELAVDFDGDSVALDASAGSIFHMRSVSVRILRFVALSSTTRSAVVFLLLQIRLAALGRSALSPQACRAS
jgi:hypothetical protein